MTSAKATGPLISVIIPAFNAAGTMKTCLEHVFKSAFKDFEVLVVDDCSADETIEIARTFDCRIIRQPTNRGAASTRNLGSLEARGQVLVFLDADVFLRPDALGFVVEDLVEKQLAPAVIGVYTTEQAAKGFYAQYQNLFTTFNHEKSGRFISWFWTAMGAVKRDAFKQTGGFNESYSGASAEDVELGYALCRNGHRILYDNRIRGAHLHHHSLGSLLRNNFKKSKALAELILKMSRDDKFAHGFSDKRNLFAMLSALVMTLGGLLCVIKPGWALLFAAGAVSLVLSNLPFYRFLKGQKGSLFLAGTIALHYLIYMTVGFGLAMGVGRYLFGRDKPKGGFLMGNRS